MSALEEKKVEGEGFFDSDVIQVDLRNFKRYINNLVITGSIRFRLEKKELHVYGVTADLAKGDVFSTLIRNGTPFFDAIIFLSLPGDNSKLLIDPAKAASGIIAKMTHINIARALYAIYFLLLTRGNIPNDDVSLENTDQKNNQVPAFLGKVMSFDGTFGQLKLLLASFNLNKIPADWVKFVSIKDLGTETRQRLTLQIAGHRLFKPFLYITPLGKEAKTYERQIEAIKEFIHEGATWDVFTPTRTARVAEVLGPLNANLGNLLLEAYTDQQINEMVQNKLIAVKPTYKYGFASYKAYTKESFAEFTDLIFPKKQK